VKLLNALITLLLVCIVASAFIGFTLGVSYGIAKPFFEIGASLFGA
jgi:hypothetical protein